MSVVLDAILQLLAELELPHELADLQLHIVSAAARAAEDERNLLVVRRVVVDVLQRDLHEHRQAVEDLDLALLH